MLLSCGRHERLWMIVGTVGTLLALIGAVTGLTIGLRVPAPPNGGSPVDNDESRRHDIHRRSVPSERVFESAYRTYRSAAITTDTNICADIGIDMLNRGGSAVDAAIASMFCVGVVNCHSAGLGGGHFATIYDTPRGENEKVLTTVVSRERAPGFAHRNMFINTTASSSVGGLAVAVPGEVSGHYESWKKFGRLSWSELVEPSAVICEQGFYVEKDLAKAILQYEEYIRSDPNFSELFVKEDGTLVKEGDLLVNPKLGATFRRIAADPLTYYNGSLAKDIVDDIKEYAGNITLSDLAAYRSSFKIPDNVTLANGKYKVYNPPPPSSGVVLDFIVGILNGYNFTTSAIQGIEQQTLTYHRITEAFKFAYAKRSLLGDEDYVDVTDLVKNLTSSDYAEATRMKIDDAYTHDIEYYEPTFDLVVDQGTAHLNVLAEDGSAVAMTGTINLFFGAKVRGRRTGIIFNDEMDDFSTPGTVNSYGVPASPSNYIEPGKMPMSSMSPTLIFGPEGNIAFMSGASGGTRITTETAFVVVNSLWFGRDLKNATDTPRIHHQLAPNELNYEPDIDQAILSGLVAKNHTVVPLTSLAVVGSIRNHCSKLSVHLPLLPGSPPQRRRRAPADCIEAISDARKGGQPAGY